MKDDEQILVFCYAENIRNLLGPEVIHYRGVLNEVIRKYQDISASAWYDRDAWGVRLTVKLGGDIGNLEVAMKEVFEGCGLPDRVVSPIPTYVKVIDRLTLVGILGNVALNRSTKVAYSIMKDFLKEKGAKIEGADMNDSHQVWYPAAA